MCRTWRTWGLVVTGLCLGCAEKSPPPVSTAPAQPAAPAAAPETSGETPQISLPDSTEKSPGPGVPSQSAEPVVATDESAAETNAELETPFALEDGFTQLTLDDFEFFAAESDTWAAKDDGIVCTGKPKGYLYSRLPYQNFTWRLEYRFPRPKSLPDEAKFKGNTGFLVYISGEQKLWPVCLEVQGKHVQMAAIKENGGAAPVTVRDDESAREAARLPVGQWNRLEIVSREGSLTVKLNDTIISSSEPNFLSDGKIGIQAEDHPFAVRRMRIRTE